MGIEIRFGRKAATYEIEYGELEQLALHAAAGSRLALNHACSPASCERAERTLEIAEKLHRWTTGRSLPTPISAPVSAQFLAAALENPGPTDA